MFGSAPVLTQFTRLTIWGIAAVFSCLAATLSWFFPHRLSKARLLAYGYAIALATWGILTLAGFTVAVERSSGVLLCLAALGIFTAAFTYGLVRR